MTAALVIPVSGPYTGTMAGFPIGTLSDDGYTIIGTLQGQPIAETDAYGMTLVEAIYRGQNWRARIRGLEWKSGLVSLPQGFGSQYPLTNGILAPTLANIGNRWSAFSASLVLTAILANPPTVPQSLTALLASMAPNSETSFMMTSKMRELPVEMVMLPYRATVGSETLTVPFTVT